MLLTNGTYVLLLQPLHYALFVINVFAIQQHHNLPFGDFGTANRTTFLISCVTFILRICCCVGVLRTRVWICLSTLFLLTTRAIVVAKYVVGVT